MVGRRQVAVLLLALVLATIPSLAKSADDPRLNWQSELNRSHPLAGRIWSAADKRFVELPSLVRTLAEADFRLLGETHDNPDHHRLQAWLIGAIAESGQRPAVVFEMIDRTQGPALAGYLARPEATAAGLGRAIGWEDAGWPDWTLYRPIAEAALDRDLPIAWGNESRAFVRGAVFGESNMLSDERSVDLLLDTPLPEVLGESLEADIVDSHCNMLPENVVGPMAKAQRLRDAVMATRLIEAKTMDGAILIAGSGHVRSDRAVPRYLRRHTPAAQIVSVTMVEVAEDRALTDLITRGPDGDPVADFFWFTPRAERNDPCADMRRQMENAADD